MQRDLELCLAAVHPDTPSSLHLQPCPICWQSPACHTAGLERWESNPRKMMLATKGSVFGEVTVQVVLGSRQRSGRSNSGSIHREGKCQERAFSFIGPFILILLHLKHAIKRKTFGAIKQPQRNSLASSEIRQGWDPCTLRKEQGAGMMEQNPWDGAWPALWHPSEWKSNTIYSLSPSQFHYACPQVLMVSGEHNGAWGNGWGVPAGGGSPICCKSQNGPGWKGTQGPWISNPPAQPCAGRWRSKGSVPPHCSISNQSSKIPPLEQ